MTEFEKRYVKARKAVIAGAFSQLNDSQLKACLATEGPLLLLAGAGSGKTTVVINRVANLIKYGSGSDSDRVPSWAGEKELELLEAYLKDPRPEYAQRAQELCALDPPSPWNIIAITFTNKAASALKDRLSAMLGETAEGVWASTFHSACCRILRKEIDRLGISPRFTIYDADDSRRLMKEIIGAMGLDDKIYDARSVLARIGRAKDQMKEPKEMLREAEQSGDYRMEKTAACYGEYQKRLRDADALDFDDIILATVKLLRDFPDVREAYARRFRYVLVDEYQDTNNLQYLLTGYLASFWGNICVVGDDDQSIYKFRGATIKNILDFENQYEGCRVIRLERNYRSTGHILSGANAVIRNNQGRKGKELWTELGDGDKIEMINASDENEEGELIAGRVLDSVSKGASFSDFAVLYRMNAQSNRIEFALKRAGVPYKVVGGTRFFERAEVKDILSYMCVVNNPGDDLRLKRIINNPVRGIGQKTIGTVEDLARGAGATMFSIIADANSYTPLDKSAAKLRYFARLIQDIQSASRHMDLNAFYDYLIKATGYENVLLEKNDHESRGRLENIYELKSSIIAYMSTTEEPSLHGFLEEIALYSELDSLEESESRVVLMTVHTAKGLEFDTVFLSGAEEGIFPGQRSAADREELEEERRLAYVAMTRAKRMLFITCAHHRMLFGKTTANHVSRFVLEIPEADISGRNVPKANNTAIERDSWDGWEDNHSVTPVGYGSSGGRGGYGGYAGSPSPSAGRPRPSPTPGMAPKPKIAFKKGDAVRHKVFGPGVVTEMTPVGNDALMEVAFKDAGTKRLMANAAAKHMTVGDGK